jgi:two-component system, NarL family, sensor histidine kinase UhpB
MRSCTSYRAVSSNRQDERRHLARELHDQMGQALTTAKFNLQAAQRLEERGLIARKLDDGIVVLETLLQQARQISLDLRPPILDDLGLRTYCRCDKRGAHTVAHHITDK